MGIITRITAIVCLLIGVYFGAIKSEWAHGTYFLVLSVINSQLAGDFDE